MKLICGRPSGFSRKVRILLHELNLQEKCEIEFLSPQEDVDRLAPLNPMGKVPVLIDAGRVLFDSPVICEYLCALSGEQEILPVDPTHRWDVLTRAALGDGTLEAGMLARAEAARGDGRTALQWQLQKLERCLDRIESSERIKRDASIETLDLGDIAIGAAIGWLEFRLKDQSLLATRPAIRAWFSAASQRPSFRATEPRV